MLAPSFEIERRVRLQKFETENRVYPAKGGDLEKTIKAKGQTWLKA
jgi:hypothetical protein